jgi:hypothetical protein
VVTVTEKNLRNAPHINCSSSPPVLYLLQYLLIALIDVPVPPALSCPSHPLPVLSSSSPSRYSLHPVFLSYPILSYPILSYPILSYPIPSCPILYYPILSYPTLSYPILSYPFLSYPILSYPILSYPILSYPILSCPILSYPILFLSPHLHSKLISH